MVEILKQNQYDPMQVANQVAIIYAGINGFLDDIKIEQISDYERDFIEYLSTNNQPIIDSINQSGKLDEPIENELKKVLTRFTKIFSK
jgi:F-type H+-transporting ATPase subunit alpha